MKISSRVFGLDFLRVIAVLTVIISHAGYISIGGVKYGYLAIESFFVMSGFLIGEMLINEFKDGFTFSDLKIFWVKRWFRTLPLYYAVLFFKFFFLSSHQVGWNVIYYIFFLQNNFYGVQFFAVSWTLVLEEWFYIILPFIIFIFFRKGIQYRKFMLFIGVIVVGSLVARYFYSRFRSDLYDAVNGNLVLRFDAFLIGVGLASIKVFRHELYSRLARWPVFTGGLVLLLFSQLFYYDKLGINAVHILGSWAIATRFSAMDMGLFFIIPFLCTTSVFTDKKDNVCVKVITWLSLLSYPMYLLHMEVQTFLPLLLPSIYLGGEIGRVIINTSFTIFLSYLVYEIIHEPMINFRTILVNKMKKKSLARIKGLS